MNDNANNAKVTNGKKKYVHIKKKKQKRVRTPEEKAAYWEKVKAIQEERRQKKKERRERIKLGLEQPKEKKPAIMKYNIEVIDYQGYYDITNYLRMNFDERAREELEKFESACNKAYQRFYIEINRGIRDKKKIELEFHQEIKKYRKVFNHNIQEITKQDKFRIIKEMLGRITEYQTN